MRRNMRSRALAWVLTLSMLVSLVPGMAVTAFAAGETNTTTDKPLSYYSNGMTLLNDMGWYFDSGDNAYQINWNTQSQSTGFYLNGTVVYPSAGNFTRSILRYTNASTNESCRPIFVVYTTASMDQPYLLTETTTGSPSYTEFQPIASITPENCQIEFPESAADLKVTADGYIYYSFTRKIGTNANTTTNYYLTADGFSATVPSDDSAVKLDTTQLVDPNAKHTITLPAVTNASWLVNGTAVEAGTAVELTQESNTITLVPASGYAFTTAPTIGSYTVTEDTANGGYSFTVGKDADVTIESSAVTAALRATTLTYTEEYPYGTAMSTDGLTLNSERNGSYYQWQCSNGWTSTGTWEDVEGATGKTLTLESDNVDSTYRYYRCIVDGVYASKVVEVLDMSTQSTNLVAYNIATWAISNAYMAYTNFGNTYDVYGLYGNTWINGSFSGAWEIGARTEAEPAENSAYHQNTDGIDSVKLTFISGQNRQVQVSVKLKEGYHALAIGTDTQLNAVDTCPLDAVLNGDGSLSFVQLIEATDLESVSGGEAAMVFTPTTPASSWWCGAWTSAASRGTAWPDTNSNSHSGSDSAMAVSWENLTSGATVQVVMSLGTVTETGASSNPTVATTYTVTLPTVANAHWVDADGKTVSGEQTVTIGEEASFTLVADDGYMLEGTLSTTTTGASVNGNTVTFGTGVNTDVTLAVSGAIATNDVTVGSLEALKAALNAGVSEITLTGDFEITENIEIDHAVTIKGDNKTLTRGSTFGGTLFTVTSGGNLTLENVTIDGGAVWSTGDGVTPANRENSGVKIENPSQNDGLLIDVNGGSATLTGVTLQNNDRICNDDNIGDDGSAIQVRSGSFTTSNSTIKDCSVSGKEGDDNVGDGAAITVWGGTASITGGSITGNYGSRHGGVTRVNGGTLTLNGTEITGNYTNGDGNVTVTGGTLNLSGAVKIDDNYDVNSDGTVEANVWYYTGTVTEGTTELATGASVGFVASSAGATLGTGFESNDLTYFSVDGGMLDVTVDDSGKLKTAAWAARTVNSLDELKTAISQGVKEITLGSSFDVTETLTIASGMDITIDLNGQTLTGTSGVDPVIQNNGTLKITNSSETQGKITGAGKNVIDADGPVEVNGDSKTDIVLECTNTGASVAAEPIGGTSAITIDGATLIGGYGGLYTTSSGTNSIKNADIQVMGTGNGNFGIGGTSTWNVEAGSVTVKCNSETAAFEVVTSGPTISDGVIFVEQTDGSYKSMQGYSTADAIATAIEAANGSEITITLNGDITGPITIPATANVTIDLNGHSISGADIGISNYGTLTVKDSAAGGSITGNKFGIQNYGDLTVEAGTITGTNHEGINNQADNTDPTTKVTITGGTIQGKYAAICDYATGTTASITGGTLIRTGSGNGYVINSYGSGKGATWGIDNGVEMQNTVAGKWINTPLDGQNPGNSQVGVADYDQIVYNVTGTYTATVNKSESNKTTAKAALVSGDLEMANISDVSSVTFYAASSGVANSTAQSEPTGAVAIGTGTATNDVVDLASVTGNLDALTSPNNVLWAKIGDSWFCLGEFDSWSEAARPDDLATAKSELNTAINGMNLPESGSMSASNLTAMVNAITEPSATSDTLELDQAKVNAKLDAIQAVAEQAAAINGRNDLTADEKADLLGKLETALTTALTAIDNATDADGVALAEAKLEAKADVIDKAADSLAAISKLSDLSDTQKTAAKAKITGDSGALATAISGIEAATNESGVATAETSGISAIEAVKTEAEALGTAAKNAKEAIDSKANTAKAAIDAMENLSDEEKTTLKNAVDSAVTAAKSAIDEKTDTNGVTEAKTAGETAIDLISAKATALNAVKADAATKKAAIEALVTDGKLTADEAKVYTDAIDDAVATATTAINGAENTSGVTTAQNTATTAIALAKAKADALVEVKAEAAEAKVAVTALNLTDEKKTELIEQIEAAVESAKTEINKTVTDSTTAVETAKLNGIEAIQKLSAYAAIDALSGLTDDEKTALKSEIDTILAETKTNVANANDDDAEALVQAKGDAKIELVLEKAAAFSDINGLSNLTAEQKTTLKGKVTTVVDAANTGALAKIDVATDENGVTSAKAEGMANIFMVAYLTGTDGNLYTSATSSNYRQIKAGSDDWSKLSEAAQKIVNDALTAKNTTALTYSDLLTQANRFGGGSGGGVSTGAKVETTENGKVTADKPSASAGQTVTLTVTPDEGYALGALTVTDSKGNAVEVTDLGDGKYSFTMPTNRPVTIQAEFVAESVTEPGQDCDGGDNCPAHPFTDVDTAQWYHEAVDYMVDSGMMNGISDTKFGPNDTTSRAMIVTILYRLEGEPAVSGAEAFDDVASGQWFTSPIAWASANGIVTGYGDATFGPEDDITREQLAAILYRYAAFKGYDVSAQGDLSKFVDSGDVSAYAQTALSWTVAQGIINGKGANDLQPEGDALRCEAAAMLMRFCEGVAK